MKRKTFAICVAGYNWECESKIISSFHQQCNENDCNLILFVSAMRKRDIPRYYEITNDIVRGEMEIFNLINYEMIDGLLIFGSTIYDKKILYRMEKTCELHNIPIVNVNDPNNKLKHNVLLQNTYSMEKVITHLLQVHKIRKINFIGGYPGNRETEERLAAYKKILTEYDIPVEENRIGYGYFWDRCVDVTKAFIEKDGLPEAIVCANDSMAILVSDYLKTQGYKIPDDIIITGFDGIMDADIYKPALTTVRPNYKFAGEEAYRLLNALIDKIPIENDLAVYSDLIIQESCGCHKRSHITTEYIDNVRGYGRLSDDFNTSLASMNIHFANSKTSKEMFGSLLSGIQVFNFNKFFICINNKLGKQNDFFLSDRKRKYGISEKVISMVQYNHEVPFGTEFKSKDLLPYDFLNEEKPCVMVFSPLYNKDKFLGYTAFEPSHKQISGDMFLVWGLSAAGDISNYYIKEELEQLYQKDSLTGLYNRRGMDKNFEKILAESKINPCEITVVCADIDDLKLINDNYGHEAGDVAIVESAKAIKASLPKDSICVRTGGDEFCVLIHSTKTLDIGKKITKIYQILDAFNEKSGLPYKVQCSCGFETVASNEIYNDKEFTRLIKKADKKLYIEKAIHKSL